MTNLAQQILEEHLAAEAAHAAELKRLNVERLAAGVGGGMYRSVCQSFDTLVAHCRQHMPPDKLPNWPAFADLILKHARGEP